MISTIKLIQQRILHHEELNELKMMNDSDVIQEFNMKHQYDINVIKKKNC